MMPMSSSSPRDRSSKRFIGFLANRRSIRSRRPAITNSNTTTATPSTSSITPPSAAQTFRVAALPSVTHYSFAFATLGMVLSTDRPPAEQGLGGGGRHQAIGVARRHEYNPTTEHVMPSLGGILPRELARDALEDSTALAPATDPATLCREADARVFSRRPFFPAGWTRRWNRESPSLLAVVSCIGGRGGSRGAGESVWVDRESKPACGSRAQTAGMPNQGAVFDARGSGRRQEQAGSDGLSLRMRRVPLRPVVPGLVTSSSHDRTVRPSRLSLVAKNGRKMKEADCAAYSNVSGARSGACFNVNSANSASGG